jgi:hypothetical protein
MTSGIYDFTDDPALAKRFYANPARRFSPAKFFAIMRRHKPAFAPRRQGRVLRRQLLPARAHPRAGHGPAGGPGHRRSDPQAPRAHPHEPPDRAPVAKAVRARLLRRTRLHRPAGRQDGHQPQLRLHHGGHAVDASRPAQVGDGPGHRHAPVPGPAGPGAADDADPKPGSPLDVSYGLGIFKLDNLLGHNGAGVGYSTAMFYLPSKRATIVVWGNNSTDETTPTTTIAFDLAEILSRRSSTRG